MNHFTPTYGASDTARNVKAFIKDHMQTFWDIMNPLLPYIIGLLLFDFIITIVFFADAKKGFELGSFIANYFYAALVISWHRVVIHGPDKYVAVNPLKPKKSELAFMGMAILVGLSTVIFAALGLILLVLGPIGAVIGVTTGILFAVYFSYKVCFYFPAKAADSAITLKQSFALTKGYFWKMMGAGFLAALKMFLLLCGYFICVAILAVAVFSLAGTTGFVPHIFGFVVSIPAAIYFQPLLTVIGVSVLSNYYLHAIQNRAGS